MEKGVGNGRGGGERERESPRTRADLSDANESERLVPTTIGCHVMLFADKKVFII